MGNMVDLSKLINKTTTISTNWDGVVSLRLSKEHFPNLIVPGYPTSTAHWDFVLVRSHSLLESVLPKLANLVLVDKVCNMGVFSDTKHFTTYLNANSLLLNGWSLESSYWVTPLEKKANQLVMPLETKETKGQFLHRCKTSILCSLSTPLSYSTLDGCLFQLQHIRGDCELGMKCCSQGLNIVPPVNPISS